MQNQKPRKRQPYAYWKEKILLWESSGLSTVEYCKIKNIHHKNFLTHKRKYLALQNPKPLVHFIQANPAALKTPTPPVLQLVLPNGIRLGLTPDLDLSWCQKVLAVAGGL
jgi:hypothetical protein